MISKLNNKRFSFSLVRRHEESEITVTMYAIPTSVQANKTLISISFRENQFTVYLSTKLLD